MIVTKFPEEALLEASSINIGDELLDERQPETGITIDEKTSKDLDDAFILETKDDGWILNVSIADVAYAVKKDSALFDEALQRIFTQYRKKANDPMLPKIISEKKLSLLKNQIRPAITFSIKLSHSLEVINLTIRKTAFKSKRRMNYSEVDDILDGLKKDEEFEHLSQCYSLAYLLMSKRRENGALVIYDLIKGLYSDEEGQIQTLAEEQRNKSYIIVQEFMILTNSAVAQHLAKKNRTIIFRNHTARKTAPNHRELQEQYDLALTSENILETLKQRTALWFESAKYSTVLKGHFGLNLSAYSHFTSPIRRLPDLINQHIIHSMLDGRRNPFSKDKLNKYSLLTNNKFSLLKKEKNLEFKKKSIRKISKEVKTIKFDELNILDPRSFRILLQRACRDNVLTDEFNRIILKRLNDNELSPEHIANILFELKKDTEEKRILKDTLLDHIKEHKEFAIQILNAAIQLKLLENFRNDIIQTENGIAVRIILNKKHEFLSPSEYSFEENKKEALRSASYEFIRCYIYHNLVQAGEVSKPVFNTKNETEEKKIDENYVGSLNIICTTNPELSLPEYEFKKTGQSHKPTIECKCKIKAFNKLIEISATGGNKKIAKQIAASNIINILSDLLPVKAEKEIPAEKIEIISKEEIITENYIGLLEEVSKKNRSFSGLAYTFTLKPSIHTPIFICKCNINFSGKNIETTAESSKKKNAKQMASKEMYEYLNNINAFEIPEEKEYIPVTTKKEKEININYTGKLLELCNRHNNWATPKYEFKISGPVHSPQIKCNCILFVNKNKYTTESESNKKKTAKHLSSLEMLKRLSKEIAIPHDEETKNIKNLDSLYLMNLKEKCYEIGIAQPEMNVFRWHDADTNTCTCFCSIEMEGKLIESIGLGNNIVEAVSDAEEQILNNMSDS